jgi:hypothetical protein
MVRARLGITIEFGVIREDSGRNINSAGGYLIMRKFPH